MLIVSKFHDYYDVGMKTGVDKTCVYERETQTIERGFLATTKYATGWHGSVLAFCGEFYPFLFYVDHYEITRYIWTLEEALELNFPKERWRYGYWNEYSLSTPQGVKKFFEQKYEHLKELFHQYRTPIFGFEPVLGRRYSWMKDEKYRSLELNPCLKNIQFYKVKNPIVAFQEIAMFMSGVIGAPPKQLIEVSDEVKAASRGHDGPYSFRKPPGKRGKNKWR